MSATVYEHEDFKVYYKETGVVGEPYGFVLEQISGLEGPICLTQNEAMGMINELMGFLTPVNRNFLLFVLQNNYIK